MQAKKLLSLCSILVFSLASFAQESTQAKGIQFDHTSAWNDILARAKAQNKMIFVDAFTTWCGPCKWMAKNVFTNDTVAEYYNKAFVCAKIDMEKGEGTALAKKYAVAAYPTLLYISADGEMKHRTVGFASYDVNAVSKKFIQDGKDAQDPTKQLGSFINKFESGKMSNSEMPAYLHMLQAAYMNTNAAASKYLSTQAEKELSSRANWNVIRDFINDADSREFNYLVNNNNEFSTKYTKDSVDAKVNAVYSTTLINKIRNKDEAGYNALKSKLNSSKNVDGSKLTLYSDMAFYKEKKDWSNYSASALTYIEKYAANDDHLINAATWNMYENVSDKTTLEKAAQLSKHSTELNDIYPYNDTYACLLYKLGKKDEAVKAAEHAIDLAKKTNEDSKSTQEMLDKIKMLK